MVQSPSAEFHFTRTVLEPVRALSPRALAAANGRMIATRWLAGTLVVVLTLACVRLLALPLEWRALLGLGAAILTYNVALALGSWKLKTLESDAQVQWLRGLVLVQVGLDWLATAVFLNLTGGICSPAIVLFIIHMLMVTTLLPHRIPYLYVLPGTLLVVAVAALEWTGKIPHHTVIPGIPALLYRDMRYVTGQIAFFFIATLAVVHLVGLVGRTLRERETQLAALLQASLAVSSTLSLSEVLQKLVESAARAFGAAGASIRLLGDTGEELSLVAAYGLSEEYLRKGAVNLSRSPVDREVLADGPVSISDTARDTRIQYPKELSAEGIRSILVVPLSGHARPVGVLRVYGGRRGLFDSVDQGFARAFGGQGAVALENALAHERLQKLDQERATFVRTITHELRSPTSGARSMVLVLLEGVEGELTDQQQQTLHRVDARLASLSELIDDLLALAEARAEELQEPPRDVELSALLGHLAEQLRADARAKGLDFAAELAPAPVAVRGTVRGLNQIFGNLLSNAVKYTPAGGKVELRLEVEAPQVNITVRDSGIGILEADMSRLWSEFFRAQNATQTGAPGTGLGLSIVKRLVERFGGRVSVHSEEGKGSTFIVVLQLTSGKVPPAGSKPGA